MNKCKLKKGDRIYECRSQQAILTELITDPEFIVQKDGDRFWHWQAKIVNTGIIIDYGISEEYSAYGPKLFRKNVYEVGYSDAEPVLPPFDTEWNSAKRLPNVGIDLLFSVTDRFLPHTPSIQTKN